MVAASNFVTVALVAALQSATPILAADGTGSKSGRQTLSEYLSQATEGDRISQISLFWDPSTAPGLDIESALKGNGNIPTAACGIAFYYDNMPARLAAERQHPRDESADWLLAIAPICSNVTHEPQPVYYPASTEKNSTMVFDRARAAADGDAYHIMPVSEPSGSDRFQVIPEDPKDDDYVCFTIQSWSILQWNGSPISSVQPGDLVQWALQYFPAFRDGHLGCYPNPYKYGKGDKVWSEMRMAEFFGYDDQGMKISRYDLVTVWPGGKNEKCECNAIVMTARIA